jgi:hypothetical protein
MRKSTLEKPIFKVLSTANDKPESVGMGLDLEKVKYLKSDISSCKVYDCPE